MQMAIVPTDHETEEKSPSAGTVESDFYEKSSIPVQASEIR
jgi:hypothetical protein